MYLLIMNKISMDNVLTVLGSRVSVLDVFCLLLLNLRSLLYLPFPRGCCSCKLQQLAPLSRGIQLVSTDGRHLQEILWVERKSSQGFVPMVSLPQGLSWIGSLDRRS